MTWGDNTDYHSFTREQCEMNNVDYDEIHAEDERCDEGCGTNLCEDIPIMCWVSKDKEEKTVCRTCYDDCGYKKTDTNSDNKEEDEFNRDGMCEGCNENAGEECSNCDNIACSECIEEFTSDEDNKRCRICADDEPDTEDEEEDLDQYDFECYGIKTIYKVIINVAGGGLKNGNFSATVEGEWACPDDFANGEDGEIHYCEYGPNPKREWRGVRLRYSDDGNLFKIEE